MRKEIKYYLLAIVVAIIALAFFLNKLWTSKDAIHFNEISNADSSKKQDTEPRNDDTSSGKIDEENSHKQVKEDVNSSNLLKDLANRRTAGEGTRWRLLDILGGVSFDMIKKYSLTSDDVTFINDTTTEFINKSSNLYSEHVANSIAAQDTNQNATSYYVYADANLLSDLFNEFQNKMVEHFGSSAGEELSKSFPVESYFGGMGNRNVRISVSKINGDTFHATVVEFDSTNNRPIRSSQLFYEQFNRVFPNLLDENGALKNTRKDLQNR